MLSTKWVCPAVCVQKRLFIILIMVTVACLCLTKSYFEINTLSLFDASPKSIQRLTARYDQSDSFSLLGNPLSTPQHRTNHSPGFHLLVTPATRPRNCVTSDELKKRFERCYRASQKRNSNCKSVRSNPDSYWRPQPSWETQTYKTDFARMSLASKCCAFNYTDLISNNPRDPPFPWELDYLCDSGPLLNMADTAHASKSTVRLLGVTRDGKRREGTGRFIIGDHVSLEVVVRNGRGQVQKLGQDEVRLWLVSPDLKASVVAQVTDWRNGTYLARSILPWAGNVIVKATIAHTRDVFRTVALTQRYFSTFQWFTALWESKTHSEATPCSPHPALPGFSANELCNLTYRNGGFPWFCGKPIKKQLNCSHYVSARKIDDVSFLPVTDAEEQLLKLTQKNRPFLIPSGISFTVGPKPDTQGLTLPLPRVPCKQRDLTETFTDTDQSGYLFGQQWRPFACKLPNVTSEFLQQCLKDTTVLYLGDSNSRLQMDLVTPLVNCTNKIDREKSIWHAPLWCDKDSLKISIKYYPPMHPFYGSVGEQVKPEVLRSAVEEMDAIPTTGKYIVHLHNFLHFMPFHLGLTEHRLLQLRATIERLLVRNPHVIVIYQSAHSSYDHSPNIPHSLITQLVDLQQRTLSGLGSRVMFARTFPIAVAVENSKDHPEISNQFTALYMGHICGRQL